MSENCNTLCMQSKTKHHLLELRSNHNAQICCNQKVPHEDSTTPPGVLISFLTNALKCIAMFTCYTQDRCSHHGVGSARLYDLDYNIVSTRHLHGLLPYMPSQVMIELPSSTDSALQNCIIIYENARKMQQHAALWF